MKSMAALNSGIQGEVPQEQADITAEVIAATGPHANARLAQIMPSLVRHLHDFAREVQLTTTEWLAATELINECGRMSDKNRNETLLLSDVFGLESLVDDITSRLETPSSANNVAGATSSSTVESPATTSTASAIRGPFYREGSPLLPSGSSLIATVPPTTPWLSAAQAKLALYRGRVLSSAGSDSTAAATATPICDAQLDVWLSAPNGLYSQQDATQPAATSLRGRLRTDAQGHFAFRAPRPTPYPIADDGPAGRVLRLLDRSPYRPAHVHFIVTAPGYRALTTQVFDAESPHIRSDSVFAVKDTLIVEFRPLEEGGDDDGGAKWLLEYDFVLVPE